MDEFARAEERARKRYERLGVPADIHLDGPEIIVPVVPKPQEKEPEKTRPAFNKLAIALTNGEETYIMEFSAPDFLENMMHSDRTEEGVKLKFYQILKAHLTSGV